jgi:hypothetical protein
MSHKSRVAGRDAYLYAGVMTVALLANPNSSLYEELHSRSVSENPTNAFEDH